MKTITIGNISKEDYKEFKKEALLRQRSVSGQIRILIKEWLVKIKEEEK